MKPSCLLLALSLVSCSGDEPPPPPDDAAEVSKAKAKAKAKAEAEEAAEAPKDQGPRALAAAQQHARAVPAIEAALAAGGDDEALWALLRLEALAGGEAEALLGRLDPASPLGGAKVRHHRLRAELALALNRPQEALADAEALAGEAPEDAAVLKARALRAGATADTGALDPEDAADALILAATQPAARAAVALGELDLSGWRARLLRAELAWEAGSREAARADLLAVLKAGDAEGLIAAGPALARFTADPEAAEGLAASARAASELGAGADAAGLAAQAVRALLDAGQVGAAVTLGQDMLDARVTAGDNLGAALVGRGLALARVELGTLVEALEAATAALAAAEAAGAEDLSRPADRVAEAALTRAHIGLLLGDAELVAASADKVSAADRPALEALAAGLQGDPSALGALAAREGLTLFDVHAQLAAARMALAARQDPTPFLGRALALADGMGRLSLRLEARLEQERAARARQQGVPAAQDALATLAEGLGEAGAPLRIELAARRALEGPVGEAPRELGSAADWETLLRPAPPPDEVGDPPSGVAGLGLARALLAAGRFAEAYPLLKEGLAALPQHHTGPWAPVSVLGGAEASGVWPELALLAGKEGPEAALCALVLHEWAHGVAEVEAAFAIGDDPSLALEPALRRELYAAHHALRQETLRWFSGAGPEPVEARQKLAALDEQARADKGFARALPAPLADYAALREGMQGSALLSFVLGPKRGSALVLTKEAGRVVALPDAERVLRLVEQLDAALRAGDARGKSPVDPRTGDTLRRALLDPFAKELTGIGRYVVLPDRALQGHTFAVLPEQQAGLRFLADIRSIGVAPTLAHLQRPRPEAPERFIPDYLALGAEEPPKGGELRLAGELDQVSRNFTDEGKVIARGAKATEALFLEKLPTARFLHFTGYRPGPQGALILGEGELTLAEVRELDIAAPIVVISGELSPDQRARWAQAFGAAGAGSVITTAWTIDEATRGVYLHRFFESTIQERAPSRAMMEARQTLQSDENNPHFDPSWWGLFVLHGAP